MNTTGNFALKNIFLICALALLTVCCKNGKYEYDASGVLEATELVVSSQANGEIIIFDVEEGDSVQEGQIVGYIDTTQLFLQKRLLLIERQATETKRPNLNTQIAATKAALEHSKREEQRLLRLKKDEAATQKQVDDIKAQINQLEAQLAAQISNISSNLEGLDAQSSAQEIQIVKIDDLIEKSLIKSPIYGIVIQKYAMSGEITGQGKPLMKVADLSRIYMKAYVTFSQLSRLKIGQKAKVYAFSNEDYKAYEGHITWISDQAEFTPKTVQTKEERTSLVYAIKIAVHNSDGLLKTGMYADVAF